MYNEFYYALIIFSLALEKIHAKNILGIPLPGNIIPNHYKVHLTVSHESFFDKSEDIRYQGKVEVSIKATDENVTSIFFHASINYEFEELKLVYPSGASENLEKGDYFKQDKLYKILLRSPLPKNKPLKLIINYTNTYYICKKSCRGFSRFLEIEKSKTFLILTQGQMTGARFIFPCFDEPKYKSFFKISVSIPRNVNETGYHVLSNTPIKNIFESSDQVIYEFEETPIPISTYLVAIVISRFEKLPENSFESPYPDSKDVQLKEFNTYGKYEHIRNDRVQKIHKLSTRIIERFTNKFKIGYAFKKLDQILIQGFSYQGMENFGLIIYSTEILRRSMDFAYIVLTHEIAHQWLGNLVTLGEWQDMWLQEGLTHYLTLDVLDEEKVNDQDLDCYNFTNGYFIKKVITHAMRIDSYPSSESLKNSLKSFSSPDDSIKFIYKKGFSVIRMLRHTYGTKVFFEAMQRHLTLYQKSNANVTQFLASFDFVTEKYPSNFTKEKPSKVFEHWYDYPGFPLVTVARISDKPKAYKLKQERFYLLSKQNVPNYQWYVPISYSTSKFNNFDNPEATHWLSPSKTEIITLNHTDVDWIIVNNQMTGYYRVNYDPDNWNAIVKTLNNERTFHKIHELNRVQILDDSFNLATTPKKNYLSYDILIDIYNYLQYENMYFPWLVAYNNFNALNGFMCQYNKNCTKMKNLIIYLVQQRCNHYMVAPAQDVSHNGQKLKKLIYNWANLLSHSNTNHY